MAVTIDRRSFIKVTTGAGLALGATSATLTTGNAATLRRSAAVQTGESPDVVVVGAGSFGMWTALNLQRLGARVTVVDAYGAGNSRRPPVVRRVASGPRMVTGPTDGSGLVGRTTLSACGSSGMRWAASGCYHGSSSTPAT